MILVLTTIIFLLTISILYLSIDFYRDKKVFKKRILALEEVIFQISKKQIVHSNQLKLSDDLNENLKKSRSTLSDEIFNLNYNLFEILAKNDLLKK